LHARSVVNLSYIGLVVGINNLILLVTVGMLRVLGPLPMGPVAASGRHLFDAVSTHQLPTFLVANVLTGAVNLTVSTLSFGAVGAAAVLFVYMVAVCVAACGVDAAARPPLTTQRRLSSLQGD
jgi:hypothetical protein